MFRKGDESFKRLLAVPEALRQLVIACFGLKFAAMLLFNAASGLPTEGVGEKLRRLIGDLRWLIPTVDGGFVVLVVECQSTIDDGMEGRLTRYVGDALVGLRLTGVWKKGIPSPEIWTITVYNGDQPWDGLDSISWCAPQGAGPDGAVKVDHRLLDMQRYADRKAPEDILFHALSRAERYPEDFWEIVRQLQARYRGPEWTMLRPPLGGWLLERARAGNVVGIEHVRSDTIMEDEVEAIEMRWKEFEERLRAEGVARGRAEGVARGRAEGVARGRAEGVAKGRAEGKAEERASFLGLLAARKFGAATAERLAAACGAANGKRIAEIVDAIYECDSGADLLARVERMA